MKMLTSIRRPLTVIIPGTVLLLLAAALPLQADQFGDFTYTDHGTTIEITHYPKSATGAVVIPETIVGKPVTRVGTGAFNGCASLASVTFESPSSVTSIGIRAFRDCTSLTSVTIPSSVTSIGNNPFGNCELLSSITVDAGNPNYSSLDGMLFDKSRTLLIKCPGGYNGSYAIPSSVTSIGNGAFNGCASLTSVTIPSSVTSIGNNPFGNCELLSSITVEAGNPNYSSLDGMLFDKSRTLLIKCPGGYNGSYAIPSSVTSIGNSAFNGCSSLSSVTIPASVTSIGNGTFYSCSGLTSVTIPPSVTSIGASAFWGCASLTDVTFDSPSSVASIGDYTFRECTALTSVTIPSSVTSISGKAFIGCTALTNVTYEYPSSLTSITDDTFKDCTALTSVTIPSSVTSIGNGAFNGCASLTSVTIPSSVTSIGWLAFYGCTSMTSITVDAGNPNYSSLDGVLFDKSQTLLIRCPGGYSGSFVIPSSVTSIKTYAFLGCANLTSVTFDSPSSVTTIGIGAFDSCSSLTSVTIPASVTSIGGSFYGCASLTSITVDAGNPNYSSLDGVLFDKSQTLIIQCPGGYSGSFAIPSSVTSIGAAVFADCSSLVSVTIPSSVTSIGTSAFRHCTSLTGVTIPSSVTSIGNTAFWGCASLASVTIPSSVTSIGAYAFSECASLTSVTIPSSVTSIGAYAFSECASLTSITVDVGNPNYSSIDGVLFDKLQALLIRCPGAYSGSYVIPSSVTGIGQSAFRHCTSLTGVTIPSSVTSIGGSPFWRCDLLISITVDVGNPNYSSLDGVLFDKLQALLIQCPGGYSGSYSIPSSVTSIGSSAFRDCASLTSVTIPSSVTSIGSWVFKDCSSLVSAYFQGDAPTLEDDVFDSAAPGFTVYYLSGSTGFTSPTWAGYPAVEIDPSVHPAATWLLAHGLSYDTDLHQDLNGDGVTLLACYGLNLDPSNPLAGMPQAIQSPGGVSMTYYASAPGITYTVLTSTDLLTWGTDGVTLSDLDAEGRRIASLDMTVPRRFMRVLVED